MIVQPPSINLSGPVGQTNKNSGTWQAVLIASALQVATFGIAHHILKKNHNCQSKIKKELNDQIMEAQKKQKHLENTFKELTEQLAEAQKEQEHLKNASQELINANSGLYLAYEDVMQKNHSVKSSYFDPSEENLSRTSSGIAKSRIDDQTKNQLALVRLEKCLSMEKEKIKHILEKIQDHREKTQDLAKM